MKYFQDTEKVFSKKIKNATVLPNFIGLAVLFVYCCSIGFGLKEIEAISIARVIITIIVTIAVFGIINFAVPFFLISRNVKEFNLEHINLNTLSDDERTGLVSLLLKLPLHFCLILAFSFWFASFAFLFSLKVILQINLYRVLFLVFPFLYASFFVGIIYYLFAESIVADICKKIVSIGVNHETVDEMKVLGMKLNMRVFFHVIFPALLCSLVQVDIIAKQHFFPSSRTHFLGTSIFIFIFDMILCLATATSFVLHLIFSLKDMNGHLEKINATSIVNFGNIQSDLATEFSYTVFLVNNIIRKLKIIMSETKSSNEIISRHATGLSEISKETADSTKIQTHDIKECVTVMGDLYQQVEKISSSVQQVSSATDQTLDFINDCSEILQNTVETISKITEANIKTILGVKNVSEQIEKVWDIINTIDAIAEKTRTIAFNAEIETSSTGESGENFHIIANEVRRLADSITNSTKEIKKQITDIQHSSDNLIISSEGGTEKIREESDLFADLEEKFEELKISGQVTAESANTIFEFTQTQVNSLMQVASVFDELDYIISDSDNTIQGVYEKSESMVSRAREFEENYMVGKAGEDTK